MWQAIIEFIKSLKIFTVIEPNEGGVRTRAGRLHAILDCGWHWQCPFIDNIVVIDVMPQILDLRSQDLTTKDGVSIVISGAISYYIDDVYKAYYQVQDYETTLSNRVLIAIAEYISQTSYQEKDAKFLGLEMAESLCDIATGWGISLTQIAITDFARTKVLSHRGIEINIGE